MSTLLGINPSRPAPQERNIVLVDYDRWHMELVFFEEYRATEEHERRLGSATVPVACKTLRRRGGGPEVHARGKAGDPEVNEMRVTLVKARVVTAANSELMTKRELKAALRDLRRRIEARIGIGLDPMGEEEGP